MTLRHWVGAGIVAASLSMTTPAWSQTYTGVTPPAVAADDVARRTAPAAAPAVRGDLALTGADIVEMVAIGAFAVSAGALGIRTGRGRAKPVAA